MMKFEWDEDKAAENLRKHGVAFVEAVEIFDDPNRVEDFDAEHSNDEIRFFSIGLSSRRLLFVVHCERGVDIIRIISARKAIRQDQQDYVTANK